jgi:protein TonB
VSSITKWGGFQAPFWRSRKRREDYRSGTLGNLLLAVGLSSALHAAVLSSLEPRPPGFSSAPTSAVTVELEQRGRTKPPVPTVPAQRATGAPSRAVLPLRYLPVAEVDRPARPRGTVALIYPENPYIWKLGGLVRLRLLINERGTVDAAEVVSAEPEGDFEEAALAAARRLVYDPALRNGRPVKSEKFIEVTFDPHDTPSR